MKKVISIILILVLLVSIVSVAPTITATETLPPSFAAAHDDYVFKRGENMYPTEKRFAFNDESYIKDEEVKREVYPVNELGTTRDFNLCPPEDGITIFISYRTDCHHYAGVRKFFKSLSVATWLDDPRIRIVVVDSTVFDNGGYPMETTEFAEKFAPGCSQNIEWYKDNTQYRLWYYRWMEVIGETGYMLPNSDGGLWSPVVAILSHGKTQDDYGNTVPSYVMDYVAGDEDMLNTSVLEETVSYIFPDMKEQMTTYDPPQDEIWTVGIQGERDYDAIQVGYRRLAETRKLYFPDDDIVLDPEITECAMQRAAELAMNFSHTRPDGRTCFTIEDDLNCSVDIAGENIEFNNATLNNPELTPSENAEIALTAWWNSEGHRNNMMNTKWNRVGIGCFNIDGIMYWVQLFAGDEYNGGPLCEKTGTETVVAPVRTTNDHLNLSIKLSSQVEIGKPMEYVITHIFKNDDFAHYFCPIVPLEYDSTIKNSDGSTLATVKRGENGYSLEITATQSGNGIMNVRLAPEQKSTLPVRVYTKTAHTHRYTDWGRYVESSCTVKGYDRRYCSCGHYEDSEKLPEKHSYVSVKGKSPTCVYVGKTDGQQCQYCLEWLEPQYDIPALGHTEHIFSEYVAPTCSSYGFKAGIDCSVCGTIIQGAAQLSKLPHTEVDIPEVKGNCKTTGSKDGKKCSTCGKTTKNPISTGLGEHDFEILEAVPATCTSTGLTEGRVCKNNCGSGTIEQKKTPKTDHNLVPVPGKAATCQGPGKTQGTRCTTCDLYYDGAVIPQRGHNYQTVKGKAATCKSTGLTEGKKCTMCNTYSVKQEVIAKTGHTYSNGCDTSCNVCGAKRNVKHNYSSKITKATTRKNGQSYKQCSKCNSTTSKTTIYKISTIKLSATSSTYNGKVKTPAVTVKDSKNNVIPSSYYTLSYSSGRRDVGTYKVTVKFKTKYSGSESLSFTVIPVKTTVSKVVSGKKSLTVSVAKKSSQVTGYEVQYSTNKNFSGAKTTIIKSYNTTNTTIKSLSAKKTYYIRVRTYKTVSGKKYYSVWSTYKSAKTK